MRFDLRIAACVMVLLFILPVVLMGNVYDPPEGGWTYIYNGDLWDSDPEFALDGFWNHDNGSDAWDGTEIGDGLPGGVSLFTEVMGEDTTMYLRMQDPGDPRQYGESDPSNRKLYLGYNISLNDAPANDSTIMDDGITISFRARVATAVSGLLDDIFPADGLGIDFWPETGDGYIVHDGGKGNFSVHQLAGGTISFCLALKTDHAYLDSVLMKEGLIMNRTGDNVNWQGAANDTTFDPASVNLVELDPREWHEYWITIQAAADTAGGVTHQVDVYMDGSTEPQMFNVTAGGGSDFTGAYIAMGCGATPQSGAIDVDFYGYVGGVVAPSGASAVKDNTIGMPSEFTLSQNYPNPFNPKTTIEYTLPSSDHVKLHVYDHLGRLVDTIVDEMQNASTYSVQYDASHLASGIYFYTLRVGSDVVQTRKMMLLK